MECSLSRTLPGDGAQLRAFSCHLPVPRGPAGAWCSACIVLSLHSLRCCRECSLSAPTQTRPLATAAAQGPEAQSPGSLSHNHCCFSEQGAQVQQPTSPASGSHCFPKATPFPTPSPLEEPVATASAPSPSPAGLQSGTPVGVCTFEACTRPWAPSLGLFGLRGTGMAAEGAVR